MRRTTLCFLSLALCFTLTSPLPKVANGGDAVLPPGCCKFFSEAEFAPLDASPYVRTFGKSAPASSSAARKKVNAVQTLLVPPSSRSWNFSYTAPRKAAATRAPAFLRPSHAVYSHCTPHQQEPVRSLKVQVAPMLLWEAGVWSDMTILIRLFADEAATTIRTCAAPLQQLPGRVVRLVGDVMLLP